MNEGPIIQANAVMFLRARHITAHGRDHESEERDIDRQRAYCRSAAERLGVTIVKEYIEYGGTGPIRSRATLSRMLGDLRTLLGVQYVLVFSLDRLARKPEDVRALGLEIQATGARLMAVSSHPIPATTRKETP